jgi:hypothetical protein
MSNEAQIRNIALLQEISSLQIKLENHLRVHKDKRLERLHFYCALTIEEMLDDEVALVIEI